MDHLIPQECFISVKEISRESEPILGIAILIIWWAIEYARRDRDDRIDKQIEILAPAAVIGDCDPNCELTIHPRGGRGGDPALLEISHDIPIEPIQFLSVQFGGAIAEANDVQGWMDEQLQPGIGLDELAR